MDVFGGLAPQRFENRQEAGAVLAERLGHLAGRDDVVVLGLPRGGVPVAAEVARAIGAPLDVFVVRKLGVPGHAELAMGAIASGGVQVLNDEVLTWCQIPATEIARVARAEQAELDRREHAYREGRTLLALEGRIAVLVDDGLATGSTMKAAVLAVRRLTPSRIVVAVPVGAAEACRELGQMADEVICLATPEPFSAVGAWYHDFSQTTDDEVRELLRASLPETRPPGQA